MKTVSVVSNFKLPLSLSSFTCCRFCFVFLGGGGGGEGRGGEGSHAKTININLLF